MLVTLESECSDACLAVRAHFPCILRALVSTDVEVFAREDVAKLSEDGLEEFDGGILAGTEHIPGYSPDFPNLVVFSYVARFDTLAGASEPRI